MRLVVIADGSAPLPAIALLHRLHHTDHEVSLVVEVHATPRRTWGGWARELFSTRVRTSRMTSDHPLAVELRVEEVEQTTIAEAAEAAHAAWLRVPSLSGDQTLLELSSQRADVIISLLGVEPPAEIASAAGEGLLRACASAAPNRAFADELRWSLLAGERPCAAVLHVPAWDDDGDAARIVASQTVQREHADLRTFESLVEYESVEAVLTAIERLANPTDEPLPAAPLAASARPLPTMAAPLAEVVDAWLANGTTPRRK